MAKMFKSGKWKKRLALGLSLSMAATLALGALAACKTTEDEEEPEEEESAAMPADTQLLKNGNFEFYSEMTKEESELRAILNTPSSWSFSSGSPSSDTRSGLIDLNYWESITGSKHEFESIADAYTNWDQGSIYDKLLFFYKCDNPSNNSEYDPFEDAYDALAAESAEKTFFNEQAFSSVDFEDVEYLKDELGEGDDKTILLHGDTEAEKQKDRGILMIHNRRTSDGAVGTAQSYSSSTTITLKAGTSAKISVWVKTAKLRHYYADLKEDGAPLDGLEVQSEAGAYIGVTQTVGGTTLDQMQIKNINTEVTNPDKNYNGWEQYTVYVRASTFASTTVKLVLGLGQGNSDDRYEEVNGYALFDDVTCDIIENDTYTDELNELNLAEEYKCSVDDKKTKKLFDATEFYNADNDYAKTFAIDLYAGFDATDLSNSDYNFDIGLTQEKSGNSVYTPDKIDASLTDNRNGGATDNIAAVKSFAEIQGENMNGYLKSIVNNDFKEENYPFGENPDQKSIILLLSANGAAYTAKMSNDTLFTVEPERQMLVSFFVKTSEVITGRTGATVTLVDGENKTTISAFDSTKVDTVDIENGKKNIYDGWVQCFFFVQNDTKEAKSFSLEFSLGPTSIASSDKYDYGQGYAAFANFETKDLTKTEYSYASTGDKAKKVSLTGLVEDTTVFDSATASSDIEKGLGIPVNFYGVLAGSDWMIPSTEEKPAPENKIPTDAQGNPLIATGLLNYKHVENYGSVLDGLNNETAWTQYFADENNSAKAALQPLVIINKSNAAQPSYGYLAAKSATISANSYQKISLRVKLSAGAQATVYLTDTSEFGKRDSFLAPNAPKVTYWYDEDGNILKRDPKSDGFDKNKDTAFELQTNGLYRKTDAPEDTNYYANLKNYKEKDGNLVLGDDTTVAFYGNGGNYYAYRTENADGTYSYDTPVKDLYENGGQEIARYDYNQIENDDSRPESKITVKNPSTTKATDWITVTFYVHTGSESKDYRLEVWAGDRENATDGIPANGYVFFDRYSSSSISNYDTLLNNAVADLEDDENMEFEENGNLTSKYAYYYTFTFYDSVNYLRYDVNEDTDEVGNLYTSYDQSTYSEEIIYLKYDDADGERTGTPSYIRFLSYGASDVTVEPDTPATEDEEETEEEEDDEVSTGDILLIVSSALLGVVLIFVIVMLLIRHFAGKRRRTVKSAPVQDKRYKPSSKKTEPETDEENPFVKNRKAKEEAEKAKAEEVKKEEPEAPVEPAPEAPEEEPAEETAEPAPEEEAPAEEAPAESDNGSEE